MRLSLPATFLAAALFGRQAHGDDQGLLMITRSFFPAGYDPNTGNVTGPPNFFGYGLGALERSYYDSKQKVFYGGSEQGFVTVSDFSKFPNITQAPFGIELENTLTDIKVCGDLLFVSTKDDPNPGQVLVYRAAIRNTGLTTLQEPTLLQSLEVGVGPDNLLVSEDCELVATANEGEGDYDDELGLINPEGSVSILRGPFDDEDNPPSIVLISLNVWTDDELLEMGVHLPLSLNAMKYWNSIEGINFENAIENYTPAMVLEPEYLGFGSDESKIYVNLQENNAVVIVDVATNSVDGMHSYGLKDWSKYPIDVVEDGDCVLQKIEGLYSVRSPDSIAVVTIDGVDYIITANESDDVAYGDYEEKVKSKDIFSGTDLGYPNMTADPALFSSTSVTNGTSRFFNADCNDTAPETPFCTDDMRFTLGSSMINYSDPTSPNIYRMAALGGRGISVFRVTDSGLEEVWDSGDEFEREGCAAFPWAHNAIQDEEFAPVGGELYNSLDQNDSLRLTIEEMNDPEIDGCADGGDGESGACPLGQVVDDRSPKDGYAAETVVVGEACSHRYAITVSEKNSVGFLYDITDITNPVLVQVFHLSPVSESMNPGLAYEARTLGEIDSESIQFLSKEQSPTGKSAVIFSGAWSGTASVWEFMCDSVEEGGEGDGEGDTGTSSATTVFISGLVAFAGSIVAVAF